MNEKSQLYILEESVDLIDCKKELKFNQRDMEQQIENDQYLMHKLSSEIHILSQRNLKLENITSILDKQIELLIQNMINPSTLIDMTKISDITQILTSSLLGKNKLILYQELLNILQKEPKYIAAVAKHVNEWQKLDYVKFIVFDLYGDQYNYREERLLLTLVQMVLKQCFDEAQDIESILRENTVQIHMLSVYTQRAAEAFGFLREIFEDAMRDIQAQTSLNLEINPVEVYKQIISTYERKMNRPWPDIRNPTPMEAADNKYVKRLIAPRVTQLQLITEVFLQKIIQNVDSIPFGIRWICGQLTEMVQQRFPEANRYQIAGLVGKYIYLRFYNPVIVAPERIGIGDKKIPKTMRRNLILIAKILQNLFIGDALRDKYMNPLSKFIESHREDVEKYLSRLIDIESLSDRPDIDNILEHKKGRRDYKIIPFKQICLIHQLLLKNTKEWNPRNNENDPVSTILAKIGPVTDNDLIDISINMRLLADEDYVDDDEKHINDDHEQSLTILTSRDPFMNNICTEIRNILLNDSIPQTFFDKYRNSFKAFLYNVCDWARIHGHLTILTDAQIVINDINKFFNITTESNDQQVQVNNTEVFNNFLLIYIDEITEIKRRINRFHLKVIGVTKARDTMIDYANYLQKKFYYYEMYIQSIAMEDSKKNKCFTNKNLDCLISGYFKKHFSVQLLAKYSISLNNIFIKHLNIAINEKAKMFNHQELVIKNIIVDTDEQVLKQKKANFNDLVYYFNQIGVDEFKIEIKYKDDFDGTKLSPFPDPFYLVLSKLIANQLQLRYQLEMVTFQMNRLIDLLNNFHPLEDTDID